ncbi:hypothetical protein ACFQ3K_01105 [Brucella gallinifaecis]|uniref:Transposase n=1 Tax=Brucella gallinifaecis TaxID=215590 RepID=A0A502BHN7_9HYPH|nr:hypothetical protein [Brucella gallinifaecis]TPF73860.1 hypothetical protein FHY56_17595 [Brucella gallinifaecis]
MRRTRPSATQEQRIRSAYIFGDARPKHGKGAALVMPFCDTHAMKEHFVEVSRYVARNAHAVLIFDQAGWNMTNKLKIPKNISLIAQSWIIISIGRREWAHRF